MSDRSSINLGTFPRNTEQSSPRLFEYNNERTTLKSTSRKGSYTYQEYKDLQARLVPHSVRNHAPLVSQVKRDISSYMIKTRLPSSSRNLAASLSTMRAKIGIGVSPRSPQEPELATQSIATQITMMESKGVNTSSSTLFQLNTKLPKEKRAPSQRVFKHERAHKNDGFNKIGFGSIKINIPFRKKGRRGNASLGSFRSAKSLRIGTEIGELRKIKGTLVKALKKLELKI